MQGEGKVPIICRCIYYLLCGMTLCGNLKVLKLPMLQRLCECLGFHAPVPPVRKKAPYFALLKEITRKYTCRN